MSYTHLTQEERYQIEELLSEGFLQKDIAEQLGRSPSTLSRELKRNEGKRGWHACGANEKAELRLSQRGSSNARRISELAWKYAKDKLITCQWSPEQIAGRSKLEGKESISHESIYQRILEDKRSNGILYTYLRCQKKRRRRYASGATRSPKIINRKGIEERPKIVEKRTRIGDWEGDTIIGAKCKGAIISSVERVSRLVLLSKVETREPKGVSRGLITKLAPIKDLAYTMTLDNAGEFSLHEEVAKALDMKIYFATPYCSWERGTNENTNGLVRQYFKKEMTFDKVTDEDLKLVEYKLNHRPRKCLGYRTPYEVFNRACKKRGIALRI
jgi:transposase, IS30 family